ncbi:MAG: hypothetical protein WBU20_10505, partial [Candidatus Acidiferrum sp.]
QEPEHQFNAHKTLKLFKPHGSVDWSRVVRLPPGDIMRPRGLIEDANGIQLTDEFVRSNDPLSADANPSGSTLFPVIAIPVQNKTDETFACPRSHLTHLKELLPSVTRILLIGWQAREAHFLQILRDHLPVRGRGVRHILVVGKGAVDAKAILHHFAPEIGQSEYSTNHYCADGGFSKFVGNHEGEAFFGA